MTSIIDKMGNGKGTQEFRETDIQTEEYKERLELLYEVAQEASSVSEVSELLEESLGVIQQTLKASASSLLLIEPKKGKFYVQAPGGEAGNKLRQIPMGLDSGIAGWVAHHGVPLAINDVSQDTRFNKEVDKATGFVTKSIMAVPLVRGQKIIAVLEVLNKADGTPFNDGDLQTLTKVASTEPIILLASMAAIAISNIKVCQAVLEGYKYTVETLVAAADAKDPYAYDHSRRVKEYTLLAANSLSFSAEELQAIEFGALLHDIGKIGITDSILRKSGSLTEEEWYIIRKHPLRGANIVAEIPFLQKARDIVLHHHERYDGTGYPEGLNGENIPIGARLVAVADAFDTMTTSHSYRTALNADDAITELIQGIGTQFCPVAVQALILGLKKLNNTANKQAELAVPEKLSQQAEETREARKVEKIADKVAQLTAKDKARREAEEARKARENEKMAKKEAERAARENAKRKAEEARKARENEKMAKKEAERAARENAKRKAEEARKAREAVKAGADISSEIYEGDVRLVIPSPAGFGPLTRFKESLKKVEDMRIVLVGGSVDEGTIILVSAQKPMALGRILSELPTVEKVEKIEKAEKKGKSIAVTLKAPVTMSVSMF